MQTRIALRSFDHGGKVAKGDPVTFDDRTIAALERSGLVSKEAPGAVGKGELVTPPPKPPKATKAGKKSSASPAAQASQPQTLPPLLPGELPPPLTVE